MLERRRRVEQRPVVLAAEDAAPVRDVADRCERVTTDAGELVGLGEHQAVQRDSDEQPAERGQQATGAAGPEPSERDVPVLAGLGQEQRRDEEPGEHEEEVHAEVPTGEMTAVEEQDPGHCRAAQTVQGRDVRHAHAA